VSRVPWRGGSAKLLGRLNKGYTLVILMLGTKVLPAALYGWYYLLQYPHKHLVTVTLDCFSLGEFSLFV
jgi:hypothetical protein